MARTNAPNVPDLGDIEGKLDVPSRRVCTKCDRKGRYHVHKLIEKYGRKGSLMNGGKLNSTSARRRLSYRHVAKA